MIPKDLRRTLLLYVYDVSVDESPGKKSNHAAQEILPDRVIMHGPLNEIFSSLRVTK